MNYEPTFKAVLVELKKGANCEASPVQGTDESMGRWRPGNCQWCLSEGDGNRQDSVGKTT